VVTFVLGLAAGGVGWHDRSAPAGTDGLRDTVSRLQQQVAALQARLRAREGVAPPAAARSDLGVVATQPPVGPAAAMESRTVAERPARTDNAPWHGGPGADRSSSRPGAPTTVAAAATTEAALDRFYQYLQATSGESREGWRQARALVEELRGMGEVAAQALMHVLASGGDSDERRAAARLLGTLQVAEALPILREIVEREEDLLLRRAAAFGLRRLQTPESLPVMERILLDGGEDRLVRMSAAYGLADAGRPLGVTGLVQIFEESTADGRGRETAFRALASLKDERPLPFMRQLATSQAEPSYRLQAIRYLTAQGDRQSLAALELIMHSPHEQPSIRDAAAQAHAAISAR
jgi:HEAT repeat protein